MINTRVKRRTRKFGIKIPTSIAEAKAFDNKNGNTLWMDSLSKDMYEVGVAFQILEDDEHVPVGYAEANGHVVFDVKMDFTRKA